MTKPAALQSAWTLAEAQTFLARLQAALPDWGVGLAGSVLHRGESKNDLDVLVFPMTTERCDHGALRAGLRAFGMVLVVPSSVIHAKWRQLGSKDEKIVEVWEYEGKRLDSDSTATRHLFR